MALRTIVTWPADVLAAEAAPVTTFDEAFATLAEDMFETMYANVGIGLAAPQVGESLRLVVVDMTAGTETQGSEKLVLANPKIVAKKGDIIWEEACLSLPGISGKVKRALNVTVEAQNVKGEPFTVEAEGQFAVVLQHEFDHLDGVVFIQRVSPLQRKFLVREYKKKASESKDEREDSE